MTPKEISEKITAGKWIVSDVRRRDIEANFVPVTTVSGHGTYEADRANAAAICNAVNGTYKAGFDPLVLVDLVNEMKICRDEILFLNRRIYWNAHPNSDFAEAQKNAQEREAVKRIDLILQKIKIS